MPEAKAIGIRVETEMLNKIEDLSKQEHWDRSTAMRLLLAEGYESFIKRKAAQEYKSGKTTLSQAAKKAHCTLWEMEQYLVHHGFKSQYSTEDLKNELETLKKSG